MISCSIGARKDGDGDVDAIIREMTIQGTIALWKMMGEILRDFLVFSDVGDGDTHSLVLETPSKFTADTNFTWRSVA